MAESKRIGYHKLSQWMSKCPKWLNKERLGQDFTSISVHLSETNGQAKWRVVCRGVRNVQPAQFDFTIEVSKAVRLAYSGPSFKMSEKLPVAFRSLCFTVSERFPPAESESLDRGVRSGDLTQGRFSKLQFYWLIIRTLTTPYPDLGIYPKYALM